MHDHFRSLFWEAWAWKEMSLMKSVAILAEAMMSWKGMGSHESVGSRGFGIPNRGG